MALHSWGAAVLASAAAGKSQNPMAPMTASMMRFQMVVCDDAVTVCLQHSPATFCTTMQFDSSKEALRFATDYKCLRGGSHDQWYSATNCGTIHLTITSDMELIEQFTKSGSLVLKIGF